MVALKKYQNEKTTTATIEEEKANRGLRPFSKCSGAISVYMYPRALRCSALL